MLTGSLKTHRRLGLPAEMDDRLTVGAVGCQRVVCLPRWVAGFQRIQRRVGIWVTCRDGQQFHRGRCFVSKVGLPGEVGGRFTMSVGLIGRIVFSAALSRFNKHTALTATDLLSLHCRGEFFYGSGSLG